MLPKSAYPSQGGGRPRPAGQADDGLQGDLSGRRPQLPGRHGPQRTPVRFGLRAALPEDAAVQVANQGHHQHVPQEEEPLCRPCPEPHRRRLSPRHPHGTGPGRLHRGHPVQHRVPVLLRGRHHPQRSAHLPAEPPDVRQHAAGGGRELPALPAAGDVLPGLHGDAVPGRERLP